MMRVRSHHCLVCGKRNKWAEAVQIEGKKWQIKCPTCGEVEIIRSGILTDIREQRRTL